MTGSSPKWSPEEDEYLRKHFPHKIARKLAEEIREKFGVSRTIRGIQSHANDIGLKKQPPVPWTKAEDQYLQEHHLGNSAKELARDLNRLFGSNRTAIAAQKRCKSLGLRRQRGIICHWWSAEEEILLESLAGTIGSHALERAYNKRAQQLGFQKRTAAAIGSKIVRLKISLRPDGIHLLSAEQISTSLGCNISTITNTWFSKGLKYERVPVTNNGVNRFTIKNQDLAEFLLRNPEVVANLKIDSTALQWILYMIGLAWQEPPRKSGRESLKDLAA